MKILHITNWYPSRPTPVSAIWIRNHIKALSNHVNNKIYHIEVRKGNLKVLKGKKQLFRLGNGQMLIKFLTGYQLNPTVY